MHFTSNLYNACTMNEMINNGDKCKFFWHIDNLKVLHREKKVDVEILNRIDEIYGTLQTGEGEEKIMMSQTHGDVKEYLGMTINFYIKYQVIISLLYCVEDTIQNLPEFLQSMQNVL